MRQILLAVFLSLSVAGIQAVGQEATLSAFVVASVKPSDVSARGSSIRWLPEGRFVAVNFPVASLISFAFEMPIYRIDGLPAWQDERFDIAAQAEREPTSAERSALLRALMKERFQLETRIDERDSPVYALTIARPDRRLGPQLRPSTVDCAARAAKGAPIYEPGSNRPVCSWAGGPEQWIGGSVGLGALAGMLSTALERPVIDRTGLSGLFDIDLSSSGTDPTADRGDRPTLTTALREQLGLMLDPQRAPVSKLVILQIRPPRAD